ncbi:cytoskeleton protein RodZ [Vibrio albus]|jgi:cytoskeleton protein RodZ|uniref:Cytoskeleton protein RodZ n=1 Tax=Vibrio albus TaxID=2200953 RepID=A0A2U3BEZ8_9VIBR|nr:cytoskeleton protein RodZ [Vibrio albus]PWI35349.1 cytoskeleton protein RodZ [Vibrio albus]
MSTEKANTEQEDVSVPHIQAGDLLREAREKAGFSQQEVADRLRLKLSVIQNIDQNDFEFDHVATFTRGYLRSYAKLVSVDERIILNALDGVDEAQHKEHSMQSFSRKTKREKHDSRIMKLTWGIFAVIIGISSVWWYQNQQDTITEFSEQDAAETQSVDESQPVSGDAQIEFETVTDQVQEADQASSSDVVTEEDSTASQSTPDTAVNQESVEEDSANAETDTVADNQSELTEEQPAAVRENTSLVMSFSADCWIQVKDAAGKTLAVGVKQAGQSLTLNGETPYSIILGAPEGVTMTFASEPVDLSGYTSGKVARFTLP